MVLNCASLRVYDQRHCLTFTISIDGFAIYQHLSLFFQVSTEVDMHPQLIDLWQNFHFSMVAIHTLDTKKTCRQQPISLFLLGVLQVVEIQSPLLSHSHENVGYDNPTSLFSYLCGRCRTPRRLATNKLLVCFSMLFRPPRNLELTYKVEIFPIYIVEDTLALFLHSSFPTFEDNLPQRAIGWGEKA
uniref:Uncharacterized protein n=1 Tax=Solanum lycopersicum TaxID=4081 RepID=A0A3Q7F2Q0_SOLLC